ncbi:three-Cys-motif partner protein TcmP [Rhizobium leguminosarum]|uniref:three-Cys-motif partner protein TcmP n=1 Tax=Rhizobium leguminosarum TaxID=384 RepID=UPI001C953220|nr:three-Cys-motif partner protein TcmP [Rhizobium leguminosarum]MBY5776238.1 three-Cys-motif partner protein TcmP [Rhizobium leguminosarum]
MGELIDGDDGLPAEEVGPWAKEKHDYLCRYVDISRGVRKRFVGPGKAGATYIDLFCGPGRAKVKNAEFIDGSCVAAWRKSVESDSPFSKVFIADLDEVRLNAAAERLKAAGAPVETFLGPAIETSGKILRRLDIYGLHFAFLDPFSIGVLDFQIFKNLAERKRMDVLVHLSKMDLQRNLGRNITADASALDSFAPGWRGIVDVAQGQKAIRSELIDHWKTLVTGAGFDPSIEMKLIKGGQEQHLYWLLLVASHKLAHQFWKIAANTEKQGSLF